MVSKLFDRSTSVVLDQNIRFKTNKNKEERKTNNSWLSLKLANCEHVHNETNFRCRRAFGYLGEIRDAAFCSVPGTVKSKEDIFRQDRSARSIFAERRTSVTERRMPTENKQISIRKVSLNYNLKFLDDEWLMTEDNTGSRRKTRSIVRSSSIVSSFHFCSNESYWHHEVFLCSY